MEKIVMNNTVELPKTAVVLGNFDGIHKGHMLLINKAKEVAREEGIKTAVFTFEPHPSFVLTNRTPVDLIYTPYEKEKIMEIEGLDYYIVLPFSKETASMLPQQFIEDIILKQMNAQVVIIGADYRFGKNRTGDFSMLVAYSKDHDFDVNVVHKLRHENQDISSTWIRDEIKKGNLELANNLMGRSFFFSGEVMHGKHLGTTIGFPTANIIPDPTKLLPPRGVYASTVQVHKKVYQGITNIGLNPTVDGQSVTVEAHILNFDEDIYGQEIDINLYSFLRSEIKFKGLEELKQQINLDIVTMKSYFGSGSSKL